MTLEQWKCIVNSACVEGACVCVCERESLKCNVLQQIITSGFFDNWMNDDKLRDLSVYCISLM